MGIELEKYDGRHTRYTCPKCGDSNSFTRFIDTESGVHIDPSVGYCNHKNYCGYKLSPKDFFRQNPGRRKEMGLDKPSNNENRKEEKREINVISMKYLLDSIKRDSNFTNFLRTIFSEQEVNKAIEDYYIGGDGNLKAMFWQVDKYGRIRAGKIIGYDPVSGKRDKFVNWANNILIKKKLLPNDWQPTQCLYGEHLIRKYPQKPIVIVESEKTAIIMSIFCPEYIWMATGGINNLNDQRIVPIKGYDIKAIPDLQAFGYWNAKAEEINRNIGSKIIVSDILEKEATPEQREQGLDIADFYLSNKE
ncbi:MAG: hypothetical protein KA273_06070 [Bacteroidales bacterium]|nr:hypothetical protein [Bacteroidales bacterium]